MDTRGVRLKINHVATASSIHMTSSYDGGQTMTSLQDKQRLIVSNCCEIYFSSRPFERRSPKIGLEHGILSVVASNSDLVRSLSIEYSLDRSTSSLVRWRQRLKCLKNIAPSIHMTLSFPLLIRKKENCMDLQSINVCIAFER